MGLLSWIGISSNKKTDVIMLNRRDSTAERVPIISDTDMHLESPKRKGITRHFDKVGRGWNEKGSNKMLYFGYTAYSKTINFQEPTAVKYPGTEYLQRVLGSEIYKKIDPIIKDKIENSQWGILIEPVVPTNQELLNSSNESRHTESDEHMIDYFADKVHKAMKAKFEWTTVLLGAFGGALLVYVAVNMHWLKVA